MRLDALQPFLARVARHHDGDRDAERSAEHRIRNPGVARRRIQQPFAAREAACGDGLDQHARDRPVLDRAAGVDALQFGEQAGIGRHLAHQIDLHQRGMADAGEQPVRVMLGQSVRCHAATPVQNCS